MTLRKQNAERTRQALRRAALRAFEQDGFEGASIRKIAADAGVSTGTVFNYARDKVDLLHQALHAELEDTVEEALSTPCTGTVEDQLMAMARALLTPIASRPELMRVLLKESLFATGPAGDAFKLQAERVGNAVAMRVASDCPEAGDPRVAALGFVSAYYFALITTLASDPPDRIGALRRLQCQLGPILGVRR